MSEFQLDWAADKIEMWPVSKLVPYEKNAKLHSPEQVKKIAKSIKEFGFINPIIIDTNSGIIAGHGRVLAAKSIGLIEVPVIVCDHLSEEKKKALIIADNQLAESGWDMDILAAELRDLEDFGFDLEVIGFSEDELKTIMLPGFLDTAPRAAGQPQQPQPAGYDDENEEQETSDRDYKERPYEDYTASRSYSIKYDIVFEDEAEQTAFHNCIRQLKSKYPDELTITKRMLKFFEDNGL